MGQAVAVKPRGIAVPTSVVFLADGKDAQNAVDFLNTLDQHPEDVLPPVAYGRVAAADVDIAFVEADPSVYTGG